MTSNQVINAINNSYPLNVYKEFNYDKNATDAVELINQELIELFNFIEPAFFDKKFIVVKNLNDDLILPADKSTNLKMNKAKLLHFNKDIVIQVFNDKNILLWEDIDYKSIFKNDKNIIYQYQANKEKFIVNKKNIDITIYSLGSRFSNEFYELENQLENYKLHKIRESSCPLFNKSWHPSKKIFFVGGGKDIPEKYMQESLQNFIKDLSIFKGVIGQFEPTREHNVDGRKPVDIIVRWEKSNRIALIEIKWLGKSIHNGRFKSKHSNSRANAGYKQLKEYYDLIKVDYPNKIIKCYLVVIDGRRKKTNISTTSILKSDGMHYEDKELEINSDNEYYNDHKSMAKPIRMFAVPICK